MTEEDEAFEALEKAQGWRKRQISLERDLVENLRSSRNSTLEEVAVEFEKMKVFGDTAQSFASFVRNMKT